MQVLKIHKAIVEDYKSYLNSFTNISDSRIQFMSTLEKFLHKNLSSKPIFITFNEAVAGVQKLSSLYTEMDNAVLEAYGWTDIDLRHDFYEVDYLPENDRVRFTIHPDARREILKRLLTLNHQIHAQEVADGLWDKQMKRAQKTGTNNDQMALEI